VAAALLFAAAGCVDTTAAPPCVGAIELDAPLEVTVGQNFIVTATHRGDGCLANISWQAQGVVSFVSAEAVQATFHADEPGEGTITARNPFDNVGVVVVEVDEADTEESAAKTAGSGRGTP
jgi:hypothetical protein